MNLDLAEAGELPAGKVRERLNRIRRDREAAQRELTPIGNRLQVGVQLYEAALALLDDPQEMYRQAGDQERKLLNQAFFEKLYIDDGEVTADLLAEPFRELVHAPACRLRPRGRACGSDPHRNQRGSNQGGVTSEAP